MKKIFDQPVKRDMITYENITKTATGQGDDYTTGCPLDYNYFNSYHKMIVIDLSKQRALDANTKAIQQIKFTGDLDQAVGATVFSIIEEVKETILDFSKGNIKVL